MSVQPDIAAINDVLRDPSASLAQVMKAVTAGEKAFTLSRSVTIGVSSSVTVDLLGIFLRRQGLLNGVKIDILPGNYDDPIGDVTKFAAANVDYMLLLPFFDTLMPAFEARLSGLDPAVMAAKLAEVRARYRLVMEQAKTIKCLYIGLFHRFSSPIAGDGADHVADEIRCFNDAIREEAKSFSNVQFLDLQELVTSLGRSAAFDHRFYFKGKAPYTASFLNELSRTVATSSRGFGSYFYKAVILDCDNTLWGGIIGEDLISGIKINPYDYPGNVFWTVQSFLADLEKNGILLCLCSKNNAADVDEVFANHPDMVLKNEQIILKKVNWDDKPKNVMAIAEELSIGLDSLIFLDDSDFECKAMEDRLPMVRTFQVPKVLSSYLEVIHRIRDLCLGGGVTQDSASKTLQYRARAEAEMLKQQANSQEDYLHSLGISVELNRNDKNSVPRISELSQKSNQFNLTTHRYNESEIHQLITDDNADVYSLQVSDRFGNAGITGVAVVRYINSVAHIEAFLMSCRVIGRGIETAIWPFVAEQARAMGCTELSAEYRATAKNGQVETFYESLGMPCIKATETLKIYNVSLDEFSPPLSPWIKISHAK